MIVKTSQIEALAERFGEAFEQRYFTVIERQMSKVGTNPMQYFASRLAAKTAVLKALSLEGDLHSLWYDIEVQRLPTGEPTIVLYAKYQELAMEQGIKRWLISITHTSSYASASVIALCNRASSHL